MGEKRERLGLYFLVLTKLLVASTVNSQTKFDQMVLTLANPHVLLEDVSSSLHLNHTVDNEFAVGSQQVSPLVQSFNFHGLVVLLPI